MTNYANLYNPNATPQTEKARDDQVANNAGGQVFALDKWKRLERFLILGSDGNTYYQTAREITRENAKVVEECWREDPNRTQSVIFSISRSGRAPKNDPAIFAVALGAVSSSVAARQFAYLLVPAVCRTGTHIFQFVSMAMALGKGFGRGMKRAIAGWYNNKSVDDLTYQVVKYRSRENLTHENLLDMAHPKSGDDADRSALYAWIIGKLGIDGDIARPENFPSLIVAHERAMKTTKAKELLPIIENNPGLPWEALPTWSKADPDVQAALLPHMPATAMIRNLGNLTRIGAIKPMSAQEQIVVSKFRDTEWLRKSRVHPLAILTAMHVYRQGHGMKGSGTWSPNQKIVDALDEAFYATFHNVVPSGKRTLLALDVSGSMDNGTIAGSPLTPRVASAAMALVTLATEPLTHIVGFTSMIGGWPGVAPLAISAGQRLDQVVRYVGGLNFGGTDCALPMLYALENRIEVDTFVIYTDNETWAGRMHPFQALEKYRKVTGIDAKLIVVGMTSTNFTIANPDDAGMLDVVGFDAAAPAVMADFAGG